MKKFKKIAFILLMSVLFSVTAALIMRSLPGFGRLIDNLENVSYDWRYRLKYQSGEEAMPEYGIHIVDIDERSMEKMGSYWNWDRGYQAKMVDSLSARFPASIIFDVLFYDHEDKRHQARFSHVLNNAVRGDPTLQSRVQELDDKFGSLINYDKQFEEAIARSGKVTLGFALADEMDYPNKVSQVSHRMDMDWHNALNPASAIVFPDSLLAKIFHKKTIIDGVYAENARAARQIGHVNMISESEVIREIPLLYKFGGFNPIYLPMSIRVAATLFGTPNEEIVFMPNKYLDIGKPFKIFKNENGSLRFSYPDFTEVQFRRILAEREKIIALEEGKKYYVSAYVALYRDGNGKAAIEMRGGRIPRDVSVALLENIGTFGGMEIGGETDLVGDFYVTHDSEADWEITDDNDSFYLSDLEVKTLAGLTVDDLVLEETVSKKLLFFEFWVKKEKGVLTSSIPALRASSLGELISEADPSESIAAGSRRDFGSPARIPLRKGNLHIVTYFGRGKKPFPYFSFYDMMEGNLNFPLEGRVFVIGSSSPSLFDIKPAPHEKSYPAVEIHASIMNSIFTNKYVKRPAAWMDFMILVVAGFIIAFVAFMSKPLWASLCAAGSVFAYLFLVFQLFDASLLWIETVRPVLTIILTFTAVMAYRYMTEEKDRKFLQSTFKQYLSPDLIDMMYTQKQKPQLGGTEGVITAFFSDIEGFSTFSEKLGSPTKLVELLNEYLTAMTDILMSHYGTLDKYIGDAIVAFYGAPVPMEDHAHQACATALDMQSKLGELRAKWTKERCDRKCPERKCGDKCGEKDKWPEIVHNMRMRIGLNTGNITTGNMGSAVRMNYTMMGDAVNLAARLESAAKQYGVFTMISGFTYEMVKDDFEFRLLDKITVVGKSEPVTVYEVLSKKGGLTPEMAEMVSIYNKGVECYFGRDWKTALDYFKKSGEMEPNVKEFPDNPKKPNPSKKFIEVCEVYIANPPGEDWDGVRRLASK